MTRARLFLAMLLCWPMLAIGQDTINTVVEDEGSSLPRVAPAYDSIFRMVQDKEGDYYYPRLAQRFMQGDTSLGLQELRCLYYGYPVQPDFNPYMPVSEITEVREIMNGDGTTEDDVRRAYAIARKGLAKKPSDIALAYWKEMAAYYGFGEESAEFRESAIQFEQLQVATASSGLGTAEQPFFVTSVGHSYLIMHLMEMEPQMQMLVYPNGFVCDAFPVVDEDGNADTLYFEVSECMKYWSRQLGDLDADEAATDLQFVEISVGTHFILKPQKLKKKQSKFDIVLMEPYDEPLQMSGTSALFSDKQAEGTIEGYFGYDADSAHTMLITRPTGKHNVDFDTDILYVGAPQWSTTSNYGGFSGAVGNEIWAGQVSKIRISNLRKKK